MIYRESPSIYISMCRTTVSRETNATFALSPFFAVLPRMLAKKTKLVIMSADTLKSWHVVPSSGSERGDPIYMYVVWLHLRYM